ncbi:MAG: hypothetical protein WA970_19475 [Gammaproteobacteria bacterium]
MWSAAGTTFGKTRAYPEGDNRTRVSANRTREHTTGHPRLSTGSPLLVALPVMSHSGPPPPLFFEAVEYAKKTLRRKSYRRATLTAAVESLHPGEPYEIRRLLWPKAAGKRGAHTITQWHLAPKLTFLADAPLLSAHRNGAFHPDYFAADITLTAPEDGMLLQLGNAPASSLGDALATYVPLLQWRAFITMLQQHQQTIAGAQAFEQRLRSQLRQLERAHRDLAPREAPLLQRQLSLQQQRQTLEHETKHLRTQTAAFLAQLDRLLKTAPLPELVRLLAHRLSSTDIALLPQDRLQRLLQAIIPILEQSGSLSCAQQLNIDSRDLELFARVDQAFAAEDLRLLQTTQALHPGTDAFEQAVEASNLRRLDVLGRIFGTPGP